MKDRVNIMNKSTTFITDLYRYYGDDGENIKKRILRPIEIKYIYTFRKASESSNLFGRIYYKLRLRRLSSKSQIQIPANTRIGEGFYLGHSGRIIINQAAILGRNVNIATGVTIGQENRGRNSNNSG